MNKRTKEVLQESLDNEKALLAQMEQNYINALADIKKKIKKLQEMPDTQSRAYQIDFQKQLETQINAYIDILQSDNVDTIQDYLNLCYETGYIGNMYQLQGYGVNLVTPINQNAVVNATKMTADGVKLSAKIAGDTALLKKQVVQEIQRGFSAAMHFTDIARNLSSRGEASMNRAMRIARTEGNRVLNEAAYDSAKKAVKAGVDTVKQWVSVLDARTRDSHQKVDSEWVELDKKFSNGLFMPGDKNARAGEIVNCRCKVAFVPRWEVESNVPRLRLDNDTGDIISCSNYAEFKEKYLNAAGRIEKINWNKAATNVDREQFERYKRTLGKNAPQTLDDFCKIKYYDISAWQELKSLARSKNYLQNQLAYVLETGEKNFIPTHTKFNSTPKVIAGKGSDEPIRVLDRLVKAYGGNKEDWQKKVANIKSDKYVFDVHWYEYNGLQYEMKLKNRSDRK